MLSSTVPINRLPLNWLDYMGRHLGCQERRDLGAALYWPVPSIKLAGRSDESI